jgi:hypothetical protein
MWLLIHFPENMKMKGPFFLSPSVYQIGSKLFAKNGYTIPKVSILYDNCSPILQFPQGTLGSMMSFDTKVVCI